VAGVYGNMPHRNFSCRICHVPLTSANISESRLRNHNYACHDCFRKERRDYYHKNREELLKYKQEHGKVPERLDRNRLWKQKQRDKKRAEKGLPPIVRNVDGIRRCSICKTVLTHENTTEYIRKNYCRCTPCHKTHMRAYYLANKPAIQQRNKEYRKDPQFREALRVSRRARYRKWTPRQKIENTLRHRVKSAIKSAKGKKATFTQTLIGCTIPEVCAYIESLWLPGMSWKNYGSYRIDGPRTWQIDHIVPCSFFNLTDLEQQKKCFHWSNLRPLWSLDNLLKRDRID
jgi:hypothetical protein